MKLSMRSEQPMNKLLILAENSKLNVMLEYSKSRNKDLEEYLSELIAICKMVEDPSNNNPPGKLLNDDPDTRLHESDDTSHESGCISLPPLLHLPPMAPSCQIEN
jgi:hypothetical protein